MSSRLFCLTGPSCSGKTPLERALRGLYPELDERLAAPVPYTSRARRPDEEDGADYHFRARDELDALREDPRFVVAEVREDLQALDLDGLDALLERSDVFYEGNIAMVRALLVHPRVAERETTSFFLSPLSRREIEALRARRSFAHQLEELLRARLMTRTSRQRDWLDLPTLRDVERRVESGMAALRHAHELDWVIPNHDGEDSLHWTAFEEPVGDARRATEAVAALAMGEPTSWAERWDGCELPSAS